LLATPSACTYVPSPVELDETLAGLALECLNLSAEIQDRLHRLSDVDLSDPDESDRTKRANCTKGLWVRDALTAIRTRIDDGTP